MKMKTDKINQVTILQRKIYKYVFNNANLSNLSKYKTLLLSALWYVQCQNLINTCITTMEMLWFCVLTIMQ